MPKDFPDAIYGLTNPFDTDERKAFRETIVSFVETEIRPYAFEWDEAGHVPWALHEKLGKLGVWGFGIDEKYGGLGFDDPFMRMDCAVALSMCGAGGVPAALGGRGISLDPIQKLAHEDIRIRVLPAGKVLQVFRCFLWRPICRAFQEHRSRRKWDGGRLAKRRFILMIVVFQRKISWGKKITASSKSCRILIMKGSASSRVHSV